MKKLFVLFLIIYSAEISAQQSAFIKPDYDKIEKAIKEQGSSLFYPKLMNRYLRGDSTMTIEEKQHLYYGFSFQKDYSPYGAPKFFDSLKVILEKKPHSEDDYRKILMYGDSILNKNPFDMRVLNYQGYAYEKLKQDALLEKYVTRMRILIDAIMSTGDGTSMEKAMYVIYISHEYDMLEILGLPFGGKQKLIEPCDYLTLDKNEVGLTGMYFDVSASLNHMSKMFKTEE